MLAPEGFKAQQGIVIMAAQTAAYISMLSSAFSMPSLLPAMNRADQRSGDKCFRGSNVYLVIQIPVFKAL